MNQPSLHSPPLIDQAPQKDLPLYLCRRHELPRLFQDGLEPRL